MTISFKSFTIILIAAGLFSTCAETETEPVADTTAYVLAYHWGFALFDEQGQELDTLQVQQGERVRIVAVNDHAFDAINTLPDPVANAMLTIDLHARAREDIRAGLLRDPEEYGTTVERELAFVEDDARGAGGHDHGGHYIRDEHQYIIVDTYMDHGLLVTGYNVRINRIPSDAREPSSVVFTANREGSFRFECTVTCGFGHPHPRELLEVR